MLVCVIGGLVGCATVTGPLATLPMSSPTAAQHKQDDHLTTQVVFTDPQVASVGLSEKDCRQQEIAYLVASYPFNDHGKSMTLGELHGHVKLIAHPQTGELLGGHIVGPEAAELIHELIAVMYFQGTAQDLLYMPHYHPTLAEILTYPAESIVEQMKTS